MPQSRCQSNAGREGAAHSLLQAGNWPQQLATPIKNITCFNHWILSFYCNKIRVICYTWGFNVGPDWCVVAAGCFIQRLLTATFGLKGNKSWVQKKTWLPCRGLYFADFDEAAVIFNFVLIFFHAATYCLVAVHDTLCYHDGDQCHGPRYLIPTSYSHFLSAIQRQ